MAIPSKQIGWSTQSNLLWQISKELDRLICVTAGGCGPTTTTTTTSPPVGCTCRPGILTAEVWNYFDCTGVNQICTGEVCKEPFQPCFNINQPYSGIEIDTEAGWKCECSTTTTTTTSPV